MASIECGEKKVNNKRRRSNDEEEEEGLKKSIKIDDNYWADIYLRQNGENIIITDKKLGSGYMWDEDEKLWKHIDSICIKRDIGLKLERYCGKKLTGLKQELIGLNCDTGKLGEKGRKKIKEIKKDIKFYSKHNTKYLTIINTLGIFNVVCSKADPESESKMNPDPHLFSLANGRVIDLKTKIVRDREKRDFITIETEVDYDPSKTQESKETKEEKINVMEKFMLELCCGQVDKVREFQKVIGQYLTGEPTDAVDVWYGKYSCGKSSLIKIIKKVVGNYGQSFLNNVLFYSGKTGRATPNLISLAHARVAFYGRYCKGEELDTLIVESFTSKQEILAHRPHGSPFSFVPKFKIVMISDEKPAFYRRDLHQLDAKFPLDESNNYVKDLMRYHLNEIFEWMVEGAHRLLDSDQKINISKTEAKKIWEAELKSDIEDVVKIFITENCIVEKKLSISENELKSRYVEWKENTNEYILYSDFKREFEKIYPFKKEKETTVVKCCGIGLNNCSSSLTLDDEKKLSKEEDFLYKLVHLYVDVKMLEPIDKTLITEYLKETLKKVEGDPLIFNHFVNRNCSIITSGEEIQLTQELEDYYFSLDKKENADSLTKIIIRSKREIFACLLKMDVSSERFSQEKMLEICKQLLSLDNIGINKYHEDFINDYPIFITHYLSRVKELVDDFFPDDKDLSSRVLKFIDDIENIVSEDEDEENDDNEKKESQTIEICRKLFHPEKSIYYSSLLALHLALPKDLMKLVISYIPLANTQEVEEFLLNL
jgi:phage/plasmid-associated DNA primase